MKNVFCSLFLFLSGKNLVLFLLPENHLYLLFLNFSIGLNFLSNSLRSFLVLLSCFLEWGKI